MRALALLTVAALGAPGVAMSASGEPIPGGGDLYVSEQTAVHAGVTVDLFRLVR